MKKRYKLIIAGLILVLVMNAGIGSAWAYFTAYDEAAGSEPITFIPTTVIEKYTDGEKHVTIQNHEDSCVYVWVRARGYVSSQYKAYVQTPYGTDWKNIGDWSYYMVPIAPGSESTVLNIEVKDIPVTEKNKGDIVNVAVVYECIPASFDENDAPIAWTEDDWTVQSAKEAE